jgi:hypothetical protein
MIRVSIGLTALLAATAARADGLPVYPVEQWCEKVSRSAGAKSEMIYGGCLDQEQSAYDALKKSWAALPGQTQTWCDKVAKSSGGGSYVILMAALNKRPTPAKRIQYASFDDD